MTSPGESAELLEASRWAAAILHVPLDASDELINAAFIAQLSEADFSPDFEWVLAFDQMRCRFPTTAHRPWQLRDLLCAHLEQLVEQFANDYFQMDLSKRSEDWQRLWNRMAVFPMLRRRLAWLRTGLKVESPQVAGEGQSVVMELVALIQQCYVANPRQSARLRQIAARSVQESHAQWMSALTELRDLHPDFIKLDEELAEWVKRGATYVPNMNEWNRWNALITDDVIDTGQLPPPLRNHE